MSKQLSLFSFVSTRSEDNSVHFVLGFQNEFEEFDCTSKHLSTPFLLVCRSVLEDHQVFLCIDCHLITDVSMESCVKVLLSYIFSFLEFVFFM